MDKAQGASVYIHQCIHPTCQSCYNNVIGAGLEYDDQ